MVLVVNAGDVRDAGSIPGLGRSRYSSVENSMDRGAWWATQSMGLQRVGHNRSD